MVLQISLPFPLKRKVQAPLFSVSGIDLLDVAGAGSPVTVLDEFQVAGSPFPPHPHAGFSAVTYVLPTSPGGLRSRDSLGHDLRIGPGGMVWTEAGRGVLHHELPADPNLALHGLQFLVNASALAKLNPPNIFWLQGSDVPVHRGESGGTVRVVVGECAGTRSSLQPSEPFTLLDIDLLGTLSLPVAKAQFGIVYVRSGTVRVEEERSVQTVEAGAVVTVAGGDGTLALATSAPANIVIFIGLEMHNPVVAYGPFIMNTPNQIMAAAMRYQRGEMGHLSPDAD